MGTWLKDILATAIPKNVAGFIGVAESVIQPVRELVMAALRLTDIVFTIFGQGEKMDKIILTVGTIFDKIVGGVDKAKNFFLKVGG